ncbi:MAG: ROK family glucokinase [Aeromicrobium sp.]
MGLTIGVDVGGTKIAAGVVDEKGSILERVRRESPAADTDAIEETIAEVVRELTAHHAVEAVGVGAAGFVDVTRSTVLLAPNLAWRNEPLKDDLERRLDLPVVIENDANAAAWGEFAFGAAADADDSLLVTVGTGVGGGIVLGGRLHRGTFGVAAEIGHLRVVPDGRPCPCGNRGCWEQYASGSALVHDARDRARGDESAAGLIERAGGDPNGITGPMITEAAKQGDPFAVAQLASLGRWLGEGIASLAAVLDPGVVVIGGGVSEAGDLLLDPIREHFLGNLTGRAFRPELAIRPAELGNTAGLIGAADLARSI